MPIYYLDTSAIVKRYIDEPGTMAVDLLFEDAHSESGFYTSFLSVLEFTSVITRGANSGRLDRDSASTILARFHQDVDGAFQLWPLDAPVLRAAVAVAENYGLRSADAIHLSTASAIFGLAPDSEGVLVSSDRELLAAAASSGMGVLNPQDGDYPGG